MDLGIWDSNLIFNMVIALTGEFYLGLFITYWKFFQPISRFFIYSKGYLFIFWSSSGNSSKCASPCLSNIYYYHINTVNTTGWREGSKEAHLLADWDHRHYYLMLARELSFSLWWVECGYGFKWSQSLFWGMLSFLCATCRHIIPSFLFLEIPWF